MTPSNSASTRQSFADSSGDVQARIDRACDALEAAWQAVSTRANSNSQPPGGWPDFAAFLDGLSGGERTTALHELIPIDVSYRRRCGAPINIADYSRFPELAADWIARVVLNPDGETRQIPVALEEPLRSVPPTSSTPLILEDFVERLARSGVLDRETLDRELSTLSAEERTTEEFVQRLIANARLTPFQFNSLRQSPTARLVFGDYVILSELGRGGMGAVFRARHRRMDRIVALKVLPPTTSHDGHVANRFRREIRAIARLSHPNIVAAHDAGEDGGIPYLVMECIDGLDLSNWVRQHGPLSVADAVNCIAQSADGMEYAHQQGIIHRDLKPSNLLKADGLGSDQKNDLPQSSPFSSYSSAYRIKILDLGLARFVSDSPPTAAEATAVTRSGMIFGTAEYMSPEQAINVSEADQRSDIYSLGCTMFFLLTGRPVVNGLTYMEMVMAHQLQELPSLMMQRSDVPEELEQVYRRMTARKPEDRFGSMREVRDALRAISPDKLSRSNPVAETFTDNSIPDGERTDRQTLLPELGQQHEPATKPAVPSVPLGQTMLPEESRGSASPPVRLTRRRALATLLGISAVSAGWWFLGNGWTPFPAISGSDNPPQPLICPTNAESARLAQQAWAKSLNSPTARSNTIGMTLILIPPGEFQMGTSDAEFTAVSAIAPSQIELESVNQERPARRVRLTKPFWIGETEVTVGQFRRFVEDQNYVTAADEPDGKGWGIESGQWLLKHGFNWRDMGELQPTSEHPASNLTWNDAVAFCIWLSKQESEQSGRAVLYRLPTEAEWEFACRAGSETPWYFGSDSLSLAEHAVTAANSNNRPRPVKSRAPNPFGLFDLYGNESEWCADRFAPYEPSSEPLIDPVRSAPEVSPLRVQRGGSFGFLAYRQRSASREGRDPETTMHGGFRIVREP